MSVAYELRRFPVKAYAYSLTGDQIAIFRAVMVYRKYWDGLDALAAHEYKLRPFSDRARRLINDCYTSLTGMNLACNQYYFADALSEAVEAADELGL